MLLPTLMGYFLFKVAFNLSTDFSKRLPQHTHKHCSGQGRGRAHRLKLCIYFRNLLGNPRHSKFGYMILLFFFKKNVSFIYLKYVKVLSALMFVDHRHAWCWRSSEEGVGFPGIRVTVCELCGF